jgi:hypothetical protein
MQIHGPGNIDNWIEQQVNQFLELPGGWLILNAHGLDDEGWGPTSARFLTNLLDRLVRKEFLEILPAGKVVNRII